MFNLFCLYYNIIHPYHYNIRNNSFKTPKNCLWLIGEVTEMAYTPKNPMCFMSSPLMDVICLSLPFWSDGRANEHLPINCNQNLQPKTNPEKRKMVMAKRPKFHPGCVWMFIHAYTIMGLKENWSDDKNFQRIVLFGSRETRIFLLISSSLSR